MEGRCLENTTFLVEEGELSRRCGVVALERLIVGIVDWGIAMKSWIPMYWESDPYLDRSSGLTPA